MGKNKDLSIELNLTSMIDLMSVLVAFLLVTAVWLHIGAIQSDMEVKGKSAATSAPPENNRIDLRVTRSGIRVTWPPKAGSLAGYIRKGGEGYELNQLTSLVEKAVAKGGTLTAGVTGDDSVEYGAVAETIDAVKAGGVESVGIVTN